MKSSTFLTIISAFLSISCLGQTNETWTEFDTVKVYPGRFLLEYKTYTDSILTEKGGAFHYPDSNKENAVNSCRVQLHGTVKHIKEDGKYRVGHYAKGRKISMRYYDADGNEIDSEDFGSFNYRGLIDPEDGDTWRYIHGPQKK